MRLAALALLLLVPATGFAFEGRVVDEDGAPVGGALVQVLGHTGGVTTGPDGRFAWTPDPTPPFYVLVVLPGDRYAAPILVSELTPLVELRVRPLSLTESVTIASGAVARTDATPGAAPSVVSGEAIRARQAPRLVDALEAVPGTSRSSDLHAGVPAIRGLAGGRTVLLVDGARVTTERRAGPSATFLDPFFLEAVEVVRGPSSVAYGSDAFGGVIHARTRRPRPGERLRIRARLSGGVGLPEGSLGAEASGGTESVGWLVQARRRQFGEYSSAEGRVPGSGARDQGFLLRGLSRVGGGRLAVSLQLDAGRDIGRPRRSRARISYPEEDSTRLLADYEFAPRWGFGRLEATAFYGRHRVITRRVEGGVSADSLVGAEDLMLRVRGVRPLGPGKLELGAEALERFGLKSRITGFGLDPDDLAFGLDHLSRLPGARRREAAAFAFAEAPLAGRWRAGAGARASAVRAQGGGERDATSNGAFSGFLSLHADLAPGWGITGQASRGFRDPTLSDRYFVGLSGRGVVSGNPNLRPERALQFDLGLRFDGERIHGGLFSYWYRIEDLVARRERFPELFVFLNEGEADLAGVELEMSFGGDAPFALDLAAGVSRGRTREGKPLDGIAPANVRAAVRRRLWPDAFLEAVVHGFAAHDAPGPTEIPTGSWTRVDAAFGAPLSASASLRVSGRNLLNAAYPISPDARAVMAPGRSVVATLLLNLGD